MNLRWRRRLPAIVVLLTASLSLVYLSFQPDDYYIYQQYARNLHAEGLPAFNPGQPSYGFTSPLWMALLGLGFHAAHPHVFPKLLSFLLYFAALGLFGHVLGKRFGSEAGAAGVLLLGLNPWVWRWSLSGMETTAALLAVTALLAAGLEERSWIWIPLGWLPLLRPELLAWTLAGAAWLFWRRHRLRACLALAPAAAWFTFARLYFGRWFPNTAHAKAAGFSGAAALKAAEKALLTLQPVDLAALALGVALLIAARRRLDEPDRAMLLLTLILGTLLAVKGVKVHTRYLVPLFPLTIALFLGLTRNRPRLRRGLVLASLAVSLLQTGLWVLPATRAYARSEQRVNRAIGRWLRDHTSPRSRVFLWDIGAITFESRRFTIDMNGLLDPRVFHRRIPFPRLVARQLDRADPSIPHYLVDVHRRERRAEGAIPGVVTRFLFSRPFFHMYIFQKDPLYYSVYRLHRAPPGAGE